MDDFDKDFWKTVARDPQGFVRTQDEWDTLAAHARELATDNERLRRFETYVCQVIAMGGQANLTVESLPR